MAASTGAPTPLCSMGHGTTAKHESIKGSRIMGTCWSPLKAWWELQWLSPSMAAPRLSRDHFTTCGVPGTAAMSISRHAATPQSPSEMLGTTTQRRWQELPSPSPSNLRHHATNPLLSDNPASPGRATSSRSQMSASPTARGARRAA